MSAERIRMWYVRESEKAWQYTKIPPDRMRQQEDYVWVPKSITEHRSKQENGLHELTLPLWFLEKNGLILLLILCLLTGCAISKPRPKRYMSLPLPGGGTYNYFAPMLASTNTGVRIRAAGGQTIRLVPWKYDLPFGTGPSNWWWNLMVSTNFVDWRVAQSNVTEGVTVEATNKFEFFRLKGRL